jgi:hypothetical protein
METLNLGKLMARIREQIGRRPGRHDHQVRDKILGDRWRDCWGNCREADGEARVLCGFVNPALIANRP